MTTAGENSGNPYSPVRLTAPSGGTTRGLAYTNAGNLAVALETVPTGAPYEAVIAGPVWASKTAGVSLTPGAKVYLNTATGALTSDTTKTEVGAFVLELASTADTAVHVMLMAPAWLRQVPALPGAGTFKLQSIDNVLTWTTDP